MDELVDQQTYKTFLVTRGKLTRILPSSPKFRGVDWSKLSMITPNSVHLQWFVAADRVVGITEEGRRIVMKDRRGGTRR